MYLCDVSEGAKAAEQGKISMDSVLQQTENYNPKTVFYLDQNDLYVYNGADTKVFDTDVSTIVPIHTEHYGYFYFGEEAETCG